MSEGRSGMHCEGQQGKVRRLPEYTRTEALDLSDLLRVPYIRGGRDPKKGLDCTGLKIEFWKRLGVEISDPWETGCQVEGEFRVVESRKFGDSLCVDTKGVGCEDHVAIYLGLGLCIHVHRAHGVQVVAVDDLEGTVVSILRKTDFA